ncbi:MAG: M56 family metallopeptidase [Bryobacteraceae bacterium]|nr:M56 family metallopeptidase [Bryobacteraceae bacterium]
MTPPYLFENLLALSAQVAVLIAAGLLLPAAVRVRTPLRWNQLLLAGALLLPLLQPWRSETITVRTAPAAAPQQPGFAQSTAAPAPFRVESLLLTMYGAGVALRLLWLGVGLLRLRRYRRQSTPVAGLSAVEAAARLTGAAADFRLTRTLAGPVTFGFRRPVVLVPSNFPELPEQSQLAIACHELLHVRRRDWLAGLIEELAATALWFHPAVWWLLAHIRLSREEAVDRGVVLLIAAREPYVSALLAFAGAPGDLDCAPAPPFLGKDHLVQRIRTLLKEVRMSNRRRYAYLGVAAALVLAAVLTTAATLPLRAAPQYQLLAQAQTPAQQPAPGFTVSVVPRQPVTKDALGRPILRPFEYPAAAREKKIEGEVVVELQFNAEGSLVDTRVLSGPDELRAAALRRAVQHFTMGGKTPRLEVVVPFRLADFPPPPPSPFDAGMIVRKINLDRLAPEDQVRVRPVTVQLEGRPLTRAAFERFMSDIRAIQPSLSLNIMQVADRNEVDLSVGIAPQRTPREAPADVPGRIRVGSNVQAVNVTHRVDPVYPPLAKQARIQGTVRMTVVIDKEGGVKNMTVDTGHPLLVPAAMEALKEWRWQPTLLNGVAVEVVSTVDLNFVLPPGE